MLFGINSILIHVYPEKEKEISSDMQEYLKTKAELESQEKLLEDRIHLANEYIQDSVLMQIDPSEEYRFDYILYVDTGYKILPDMQYQNPNLTPLILSMYVERIWSGEFLGHVAEELDLETWQLKELISCYHDQSSVLHVSVWSKDHENGQKIMDLLKKEIQSLTPKLQKQLGDFTTQVMTDVSYTELDTSLLENQKDRTTALYEDQGQLLETRKALKELKEPGISFMKLLFITVVLGLLLPYAFYCVVYICSRRFHAASELSFIPELSRLGSISSSRKLNKLMKWVYRVEDRCLISLEDSYALTAANIKNICGDRKNLLMVGDAPREVCEAVAKNLQEKLPGIKLIYEGSLLTSPKSAEAMEHAQAVILCEQCLVSSYSHINQELDQIKACDKEILGCIVVEY